MNTRSIKTIGKGILFGCAFATLTFTSNLHSTQAYPRNLIRSTPSLHLSQSLQGRSQVQAVTSVGLTVADMDRAVEFYSQVLSFQKISDVEVWGTEYEQLQGLFGIRMRIVQMQLGNEVIELTDYLTPGGRPIPVDSRSNDRTFQHMAIVVSDMDRAYQKLRQHKIQYVSTAPQRLPAYIKPAAGIEAFYFRDPDGHNLEIIDYPSGKGDPKWQKPTDKLFLGIDHTAIAVANTANSLRFYRDLLGLRLAGESENYGNEQAHLNNVAGARLRISALRSPTGAGIEFLEYLQPRDGKSMPKDARTDDLINWQTTLIVDDVDALAQRLQKEGYTLVSSGVIEMPKKMLGFRKGFLVRDPDGHIMRIIEK
jgi:catechol 2,3-dioxygenase-like lactoylglutathione lyase family enzyme